MPWLFKEHSSVCNKLYGGSLTFPWVLLTEIVLFQKQSWDLAGGPVVKNPPCNTEDAGLILGQRTKISHAAEQLNLRPTTAEPGVPQLKSPCAATKDPACRN